MKNVRIARIYRFNDRVAISLPDSNNESGGKTVYLTAAQAHTLGTFLQDFALDIHNIEFIESVLTSKEINEKGEVS